MKKIQKILSVVFVAVMLLSAAPLGQIAGLDFMSRASAANEKTVSVQFIVDSHKSIWKPLRLHSLQLPEKQIRQR